MQVRLLLRPTVFHNYIAQAMIFAANAGIILILPTTELVLVTANLAWFALVKGWLNQSAFDAFVVQTGERREFDECAVDVSLWLSLVAMVLVASVIVMPAVVPHSVPYPHIVLACCCVLNIGFGAGKAKVILSDSPERIFRVELIYALAMLVGVGLALVTNATFAGIAIAILGAEMCKQLAIMWIARWNIGWLARLSALPRLLSPAMVIKPIGTHLFNNIDQIVVASMFPSELRSFRVGRLFAGIVGRTLAPLWRDAFLSTRAGLDDRKKRAITRGSIGIGISITVAFVVVALEYLPFELVRRDWDFATVLFVFILIATLRSYELGLLGASKITSSLVSRSWFLPAVYFSSVLLVVVLASYFEFFFFVACFVVIALLVASLRAWFAHRYGTSRYELPSP